MSSEEKIKKTGRIRTSKACNYCRQRKVKCNGVKPCLNCVKYNISCQYSESPTTKTRKRRSTAAIRKAREELAKKNNNFFINTQTSSLSSYAVASPVLQISASSCTDGVTSGMSMQQVEKRLIFLEKSVEVLFNKLEDFLVEANDKLEKVEQIASHYESGSPFLNDLETSSEASNVEKSEDMDNVVLKRFDTNTSTDSLVSSLKSDIFDVNRMISDLRENSLKMSSNKPQYNVISNSSLSLPISDPSSSLYLPSIDLFNKQNDVASPIEENLYQSAKFSSEQLPSYNVDKPNTDLFRMMSLPSALSHRELNIFNEEDFPELQTANNCIF